MDPRPQPIWQRWMKDPKKAERLYKIYYITLIVVNLTIALGVVLFFVLKDRQ